MSVPHTGRLTALVRDHRCTFNGDTWNTPDAELTAILNEATASAPKTHYDIRGLAHHILIKTGLLSQSQILDWKGDSWDEELPPGAID